MLKKIKFYNIIFILFYVFIFSFLLYNSFRYLDPDLGWHLQVGKEIIQNKEIPHIEHYDYPIAGQKWVDHEWLFNAITYYIYDNFNYIIVNIFFAFIIIFALVIQYFFTKKQLNKKGVKIVLLIFVWQFFGCLAMYPHLGVRLQEITLLGLLLVLIILYNFNKKQNYKILIWLIPLFYVWACLHAGYAIGLAVLGFWLFIKIIERILEKYKFFNFLDYSKQINNKKLIIFSIFCFFSFLATLNTPYGIELYSFLKTYGNIFYLTRIGEWFSAWMYPIAYYQLFYASIAVTFVGINIININKNNKINKNAKKICLWQIALFFLFLIMQFKSKRHFPLFYFVSFYLIIDSLQNIFILPKQKFEFIKKNILIKLFLASSIITIIAIILLNINYTNNPFKSDNFCKGYPCEAVDFLKNNKNLDQLNIFNPYSWGGYMIWAYPERKLFIDGRLPQYEYGDRTFLEEYFDFFDEEKLQEKLTEYNIKLILLQIRKPVKFNWFEKYVFGLNEEKINSEKNYLREFLENNENWKIIYNDNISEIYVKK